MRCSSSSSSCFLTWFNCWAERDARSTLEGVSLFMELQGRVVPCWPLGEDILRCGCVWECLGVEEELEFRASSAN